MGTTQRGIKKIDEEAVDGLLGVSNSLAYKVEEIEKHLHNKERWYGVHPTPVSGVNEGQVESVTPFMSSILVGETWGAWVPILGTGDTPAIVGKAKYDAHKIIISDLINDGNDPNKHIHFFEIAWGASGSAGLAAGDYTESILVPEKDGKASPLLIMMPRLDNGTKLFLRHKVVNRDTQAVIDQCSMDFYIGIHEYKG